MEYNTITEMRRILFLLLLGSLSSLLISCNKEGQKDAEEGIYVVSVGFSGDISVTDEPLTKSGTPTNDLYGINVYYDYNKDGNIEQKYAYGLFDNISDMTIPLLSGHRYKFECTLVKNGKTLLESSNIGQYSAPFGQILENQFILGTDTSMDGIKSGTSRLKGKSYDTATPKLDRYYGETTNYTPTNEGTVVINLYRTSFGAKFIVTGLVNDGTLTATSGKLDNDSSYSPGSENGKYWSLTTRDNVEQMDIYTFPDVYGCWLNRNTYSWGGYVRIKYDSDRGVLWDISKSQSVTWKRNVLTTVTIAVDPDLSGGSVNITEEALGDDNVIDIGINGDGVIDTIVEPTV